uniref:PDZ domain-containing protein n=1 Tax=Periophthalmus magnuspinnatus TaxID=409849 RepID=A0A3B4B8H7_9GOBI
MILHLQISFYTYNFITLQLLDCTSSSLAVSVNPRLNTGSCSASVQLTDGGKAAKGGVAVGDLVLSIDGISTDGMNHLEAQNKIKNCTGNLSLNLVIKVSVVKTETRAPRKHIVDTDIHFYHVPTHADASRKRIMEDTEDWRPRTGTTQSRSFRILAQITGTENRKQNIRPLHRSYLANKSAPRLVVGPKYNELRDWHHGVSARTLNVQ